MDLLTYLRLPTTWFSVGQIIVGLTWALIAVGLWTAFWQYQEDHHSNKFFAQHNAWWTGLVIVIVGVVFLLFLAAPAIIEALAPLWHTRTVIAVVLLAVAAAIIGLGYYLYKWSRSKQSQGTP